MHKKLIIVGAGNLGREVLSWLSGCAGFEAEWTLKGFLDDGSNNLQELGYTEKILGTPDQYSPEQDDVFLIAVASTRGKTELAKSLAARGARFLTLIHNTVILAQHVKIHEGCMLLPYSVVSCDTEIESHVIVNLHSTVGHDVKIGAFSTLSCHCDVMGKVRLGRGVFLGSHSAVLPGVTVGDYATIGAGSTAHRAVKAEKTILGVPGANFPTFA